MGIIDFKKQLHTVLSPIEYLSLSRDEKDNIKSTKILPPKVGRRGFGGIIVEYKNPIYHVDLIHER